MSDMMMFPNTVEEFMEQYKIVDTEKIYTNGADLVPIFRMMQWFEHVSATDKNVGTTISRQQAIDEIDEWIKAFRENGHKESAADACLIQDGIIQLPPAQPEIVRCKDCNHFYKDNLNQWCFLGKYGVKENDFCSRAERRTDDKTNKGSSC